MSGAMAVLMVREIPTVGPARRECLAGFSSGRHIPGPISTSQADSACLDKSNAVLDSGRYAIVQ